MFHSERGHSFDFILCNTCWDNEQSRVSVTHFIITVDLTDGPALIWQTLQTVWDRKMRKEKLKRGWMKQYYSGFMFSVRKLYNVQVSPFFYTQPLDHKPSIHPQEIALCIGMRIGTRREKGANGFEDLWTNCTQTNHCSDWRHDVPAHWTGGRHTLSTHLKSPNYSVAPFYKQTWDSSYPIKREHRSLAWKNYSFGDWNQIKLWK